MAQRKAETPVQSQAPEAVIDLMYTANRYIRPDVDISTLGLGRSYRTWEAYIDDAYSSLSAGQKDHIGRLAQEYKEVFARLYPNIVSVLGADGVLEKFAYAPKSVTKDSEFDALLETLHNLAILLDPFEPDITKQTKLPCVEWSEVPTSWGAMFSEVLKYFKASTLICVAEALTTEHTKYADILVPFAYCGILLPAQLMVSAAREGNVTLTLSCPIYDLPDRVDRIDRLIDGDLDTGSDDPSLAMAQQDRVIEKLNKLDFVNLIRS